MKSEAASKESGISMKATIGAKSAKKKSIASAEMKIEAQNEKSSKADESGEKRKQPAARKRNQKKKEAKENRMYRK